MPSFASSKQIVPFEDPPAAPDSPHDAMGALRLSAQTQIVAWIASQTRRQWVWAYPSEPNIGAYGATSRVEPRASITAVDTWTEFSIGGTGALALDFGVPWRHTEGYHSIVALADLLSNERTATMQFRIKSEALVDAVATTYPILLEVPKISTFSLSQMTGWDDINHTETSIHAAAKGPHGCFISSVAVPASRLILLTPEVKLTELGSTRVSIASTMLVHMARLQIFEMPDASYMSV